MDCQRVRTELAELAAGQAAAHRVRVLEAHVDTCPACAQALEEEHLLRTLAGGALAYTGPTYTYQNLRARMHQLEPLERVMVILPKLRRIGATPRFAVALILLVGFGGIGYAARNTRDLYLACKNPILAQREFVDENFPEIYDTVYANPKDTNPKITLT